MRTKVTVLEVTELESRIVLTPPRPFIIPPVGTYIRIDDLNVTLKQNLLVTLDEQYVANQAKIAALDNVYVIGLIALLNPAQGAYDLYNNSQQINQLQVTNNQIALEYWYTKMELP